MSLPTPPPGTVPPLHTRTSPSVAFARPDGPWDMEGELHDTKHHDHPNGPGTRLAGTGHPPPVRARPWMPSCASNDIATSMDTAPFGECGVADQHMRRFIGLTMGKGWRKTIEATVVACKAATHLRELLFKPGHRRLPDHPHHLEMQRLQRGESWHSTDTPPFSWQMHDLGLQRPVVAATRRSFFQGGSSRKRLAKPANMSPSSHCVHTPFRFAWVCQHVLDNEVQLKQHLWLRSGQPSGACTRQLPPDHRSGATVLCRQRPGFAPGCVLVAPHAREASGDKCHSGKCRHETAALVLMALPTRKLFRRPRCSATGRPAKDWRCALL